MTLPSLTMQLPSASGPDHTLAAAHAPALMVDDAEPALPGVIGYTVFTQAGPSPSSKFEITPPVQGKVIEYAIWYDWDIQHLYDLEHVWVHLDASGTVSRVEGSMHGYRVSLDGGSSTPQMQGTRPVLFVEPGKHAIWAEERPMAFIAGDMITRLCGPEAGAQGVHIGNRFAQSGGFTASTLDHRLAKLALQRAAFAPSFSFQPAPEAPLIPWPALEKWIPTRVTALIAALPAQVPHLAAILLDCGDTLVDETTEQKIPGTEIVTAADAIPDAMEAVRTLYGAGYPLALVADGPRETFENLLKPRGIWELMQTHAISGDVGVLKPDARMFRAALKAMGLSETDMGRVVMVGNNLARDIRGANEMAMKSIHVAWSKKRSHEPLGPAEQATLRIDQLSDLPAAIAQIERALPMEGPDD